MPQTETKSRSFEVEVPPLRVFRHLDNARLHPNVEDVLTRREGRSDYIDTDLSRDFEETEEIMEHTIGAALVDSEGEILYQVDGKDAFEKVAKAAASAKVTVSLDFDEPKVKPRPVKAGAAAIDTGELPADEPETKSEDAPF